MNRDRNVPNIMFSREMEVGMFTLLFPYYSIFRHRKHRSCVDRQTKHNCWWSLFGKFSVDFDNILPLRVEEWLVLKLVYVTMSNLILGEMHERIHSSGVSTVSTTSVTQNDFPQSRAAPSQEFVPFTESAVCPRRCGSERL